MKVLVFAHKPPPHHGQSYMVQQLVDGLGGDCRAANGTGPEKGSPTEFECYHVDARLSSELANVGRFQPRKLWLLFRYCLEAIQCRFRHGVTVFLYIPAPPLRAAVFRDWLVMFCCRPFFKQRVFYWQASGLGPWLTNGARAWERWLTRALLGNPDLSIVLSDWCRVDATALGSRTTRVISNGVPDPCPDFSTAVLPVRLARFETRTARRRGDALPNDPPADASVFRVLFLSLCTREKGLFDAVDGVELANRRLREQGSPLRVQLTVAGKFWQAFEREEFDRRVRDAGNLDTSQLAPGGEPMIRYCGFVSGAAKTQLFLESDCFCFPTYYSAESFGIVIIEAMAFGLPIIATDWRSVPELLPSGYPGIVQPRSPKQIAERLLAFLEEPPTDLLRRRFLSHYTIEECLRKMKSALNELQESPSNTR